MPKTLPSLAIFNSSQDTIDLLKAAFEEQGFSVASTHVPDLRKGHVDVIEFVRQNEPDVIIFDIALPYEENLTFFKLLQSSEPLRKVRWVLTTTNSEVLLELAGDLGKVHEIVGKPYDLDQIVVRQGRPDPVTSSAPARDQADVAGTIEAKHRIRRPGARLTADSAPHEAPRPLLSGGRTAASLSPLRGNTC